MRTLTTAAALVLLGSLGCSGSGSPATPSDQPLPSSTPQAVTELGAAYTHAGWQEAALALYTLDIDPAALSATASLKAVRQGQANDDLYLLSINNFLRPDSFRVAGVARSGSALELTYLVTHPFPAPENPLGAPNGFSNRSDLGIAGRVLFLLDAAASGNTYFTDRVADTGTVINADGYYSPEDLISYSGTANTFPFRQLVDESGPDGSRRGITNGGNPKGNFGGEGWTRAKYGPGNNGWTGYGVLHQGQSSIGMVAFDTAALGSGLSLDVAIIAKYNDPRGGLTAAQKRANRLPGPSPDHTQFAYRMPHGALDVASLTFTGDNGPGFTSTGISGTELSFALVDWDANANPSPQAPGELQGDPIVTNVELSEIGSPAVSVCIPGVLGDATVTADVAEEGSSGEGIPGDPLLYRQTVAKSFDTTAGTYTGLARAIDPEDTLPWPVPLDEGVPPLPLGPGTTPPRPVVYQAFNVAVTVTGNNAPVATYVISTPTIANGGTVSLNVQGLNDLDADPVDILVDWDDDGTFTFAQTVNAPYPANIPLTSPITYTHNPPAPDTRDLPVRITDSVINVDLTPVQTFEVNPPSSIVGWGYTLTASTAGIDRIWSLAVDTANNVWIAGDWSTTAPGNDYGGGLRAPLVGDPFYLVKLNGSTGAHMLDRVWSATSTTGRVVAVGTDSANNVYVSQTWNGTLEIAALGGGAVNQVGNGAAEETAILKFDSSGNFLGLARSNDPVSAGQEQPTSFFSSTSGMGGGSRCMVVDKVTNRIYMGVSPSAAGTLDFGGTTVTANGLRDAILVRYDAAGLVPAGAAAIWAINLVPAAAGGSSNNQRIQSLAVNPATGDVIAGGVFDGSITANNFGDAPVLSTGAQDVFLVKYTAAGTFIAGSQRTYGSTASDTVGSLGADADGIYVGGSWGASVGDAMTLGAPLPNMVGAGTTEGYVGRFSHANVPIWQRHLTSSSSEHASGGIAIHGSAIYVVGLHNYGSGASSDWGYVPLLVPSAPTSNDAVLAKYDRLTGATSHYAINWRFAGFQYMHAVDVTSAGDPIMALQSTSAVAAFDLDPGPGVDNHVFLGNDFGVVKLNGVTATY